MSKKKMITKTVYRKQSSKPFIFKDYKSELLDDDMLEVGYDEGFYNENNSHYFVHIRRQVLETDEEYKNRIEYNQITKKK